MRRQNQEMAFKVNLPTRIEPVDNSSAFSLIKFSDYEEETNQRISNQSRNSNMHMRSSRGGSNITRNQSQGGYSDTLVRNRVLPSLDEQQHVVQQTHSQESSHLTPDATYKVTCKCSKSIFKNIFYHKK